MGSITGRMAVDTRAVGTKTKCQAKALLSGSTVDISSASSRAGSCMAKGFTHGKMAGATKASTSKIRSMAQEFTPILMEANTRASGAMGSKTGKDA